MSLRVIQAYFPGGRLPASFLEQSLSRPFGEKLPPHPAKVVQRRASFFGSSSLPPHPAKVGRPSSADVAPAQPKIVAQRFGESSHAFQPPSGFLEGGAKRPGQPLPVPVRRKMETFFGADFSDVRVHVGDDAPKIGAIAFTLGSDLYFAPGEYDPHSPRGQELLGHELTHVVQQREGRVANPYGDGVAVVHDAELEAEADRNGRAVAAQPSFGEAKRPVPFGKAGSEQIQRKEGAGYRLIFGTYMHQGEKAKRLPKELAGHSFVALEEPSGERHAWGFSPKDFGRYDPRRDLGKLTSGVPGVVHDDESALEKPGVRTRSYTIDAAQAQAAKAKVEEYRSGKYSFNLRNRQCSAFALDVLRAADVEEPVDGPVQAPEDVYRKI